MRAGRRTASAVLVASIAVTVSAAGMPAASGAGSTPRAGQLLEERAALERRARSALLGLYALDAQLARARAELAQAKTRRAAVARERASLTRRLAVAGRTLRRSQRQLGARVRSLYEQGRTDTLGMLLGATSVEEALDTFDGLEAAAAQDKHIAGQARTARRELTALAATLERRGAELERVEAAARSRSAALERTRAGRAEFLSRLAAERRLNEAQLAELERRAAAAQERSQRVAPSPRAAAATADAPASPPDADTVSGERTLTVSVTGYALPGVTATGLPVGWGVVAVDPSVIPLGTRMTIPGYGEGVAADVGPGVHGAAIDIWFPTVAEARRWGRRVVRITLHADAAA